MQVGRYVIKVAVVVVVVVVVGEYMAKFSIPEGDQKLRLRPSISGTTSLLRHPVDVVVICSVVGNR